MNNEREILFDSVAAIIYIQPTNEMFPRIMTSRDITVGKSLAQFIYGCFKQITTSPENNSSSTERVISYIVLIPYSLDLNLANISIFQAQNNFLVSNCFKLSRVPK